MYCAEFILTYTTITLLLIIYHSFFQNMHPSKQSYPNLLSCIHGHIWASEMAQRKAEMNREEGEQAGGGGGGGGRSRGQLQSCRHTLSMCNNGADVVPLPLPHRFHVPQMSNKRSNSFRRAILQGSRQLRGCSLRDEVGLGLSQRLVRHVAYETLPREVDRKWYFDSYTYCPPPWLILAITIAEVRQTERLKRLPRSLVVMLSLVCVRVCVCVCVCPRWWCSCTTGSSWTGWSCRCPARPSSRAHCRTTRSSEPRPGGTSATYSCTPGEFRRSISYNNVLRVHLAVYFSRIV